MEFCQRAELHFVILIVPKGHHFVYQVWISGLVRSVEAIWAISAGVWV